MCLKKNNKFPKRFRLHGEKTVTCLFSGGQYASAGFLNFKFKYQEQGSARFAISVSKRVGNSPKRNRIKRLIRECLRHSDRLRQISIDCCIFITKPPREEPSLSEINGIINQFFISITE